MNSMASGTMPSCLVLSMSEQQSHCQAAKQNISRPRMTRNGVNRTQKIIMGRATSIRMSASEAVEEEPSIPVTAFELPNGPKGSVESSSVIPKSSLKWQPCYRELPKPHRNRLSLLWSFARSSPDIPIPEHIINDVLASTTSSLTADKHIYWPTRSLASTFEALGELGIKDTELLIPLTSKLTEKAVDNIYPWGSGLDALTIVKVFNALAALQYRPPELISALAASLACPGALDSLPPLKLQRLIRSLSALDWPVGSEAVLALAGAFSRYHRIMDASEVAEMAWVLARRGGAEENALAAFVPAVRAALPRCGMKQLADVSRAYSKVPSAAVSGTATQDGLFEAIAARAACCVDGAAPEDISRVIGAFDQVGIQPEALLEVVEQWADRRLAALSSQALALALASFAKLGNRSLRLLQTAAACVKNKLEEMQRSEIAMAVWAFGRLEFDPGIEVLSHAERAVAAAPTAFSDREASNLLWALARLNYSPSAENISFIATGLVPVARKYSGISAALVLWAFATFNQQQNQSNRGGQPQQPQQQQQLCEALGCAVAREIHSLDPQTLSMTAWALGILGYKHETFATEVAALGSSQLSSFSPQNLSNLGWGIAKSGADPGSLFLRQYELAAIDRLNEFSAQELFCVCWTCATLRYPSVHLAAAAAAELRDRRGEFGALELSGIIWALARMLRPHQGATAPWAQSDLTTAQQPAVAVATIILAAVDRELPGKIDDMESTQLAMAVWGLGRLCEAAEFTSKAQKESNGVVTSVLELPEATSKAVHRALTDAIPCMNAASLISVLEGLSCLNLLEENKEKNNQNLYWGGLFEAASERALALMHTATLRPWEFPSLVYYLTCIGEIESAKILLQSDNAVDSMNKTTPKGSILVLAAMARAQSCPVDVLTAARKRLSKLASSYRINSWHLITLYEALEGLEPEQAQRIKLSNVWTARMLSAHARFERIKNRSY